MKKSTTMYLAVVSIVALQASVQAGVTYTNNYANAGDAPIYGTMIDPSGYYLTDGAGDAKTAGNALDKQRVYLWDYGYPNGTFEMMKWDMGSATNFVRVYPDVEHDGGNVWDYLQWSLWGSNNPAENSGAWTLLWDPTAASGSSVNDFVATSFNGSSLSEKVYRYGTNLDVGTAPGDAYSDAFTIDFGLADSYRYFGIRGSTIALNNTGHLDPEINAVATATTPIPAPGAILLGTLGAGLVGWLRRRRVL
jgi:hypothetical protein